jgi:hypothetical protein
MDHRRRARRPGVCVGAGAPSSSGQQPGATWQLNVHDRLTWWFSTRWRATKRKGSGSKPNDRIIICCHRDGETIVKNGKAPDGEQKCLCHDCVRQSREEILSA